MNITAYQFENPPPCTVPRLLHGLLHDGFVKVVATLFLRQGSL